VKAQGDGWLTSVTLVEGANIGLADSGAPSPYVVFTCNGKNRASSVKLRTGNPTWRGENSQLSFIVLMMF
jgi:Ca2+-dependent lipid-binding protein